MVRSLERLGVSAVIIEDKKGNKRNSLFGTSQKHLQATPEEFSEKINIGKKSQITEEFLIIARIESLITGSGLDDALMRAAKYIDSGADGIMIHSADQEPDEVYNFAEEYKKNVSSKPLIVVPSSFSQVTESELEKNGVNIVIYANQLLRSAIPSMLNAAKSILDFGSSHQLDGKMMSIKDILELFPAGDGK